MSPGNAGTVGFARFSPDDADLVVVGPEVPLAEGIAARWPGRCFGPSAAAAEIESSKAFAKAFMRRQGIPTADFETFTELEPALRYAAGRSVVIKASGLAAGKGVVLPGLGEVEGVLRRILVDREFGEAGAEVVVEERLEGPEVSLLGFTDGKTVRLLPTAADHKRLLDGDQGPNTGGMGAYAPTTAVGPELLQRAVDGLAEEGRPFVGVLYAGLMLTPEGPRVLEFNCRLGDPETQVLLPLLDTPLVEVVQACVEGRLDELTLRWKEGSAACVVAAAPGYPGKVTVGGVIEGLDEEVPDTLVFHAGTRLEEGRVVTAGGRVLGVTGLGVDRAQALARAYERLGRIRFPGMQFRQDIGR